MLSHTYQTGRHGGQNGYKLVLVHQGFQLEKLGTVEDDDIDKLQKERISQGHREFVILADETREFIQPDHPNESDSCLDESEE
jgi:hypothetical protein